MMSLYVDVKMHHALGLVSRTLTREVKPILDSPTGSGPVFLDNGRTRLGVAEPGDPVVASAES